MEVVIKDCADNLYVIEVGVDDTTEEMRQKVATAAGLAEDSFHMGFGGKEEGEDIAQLSAGDTIILTKTQKYQAIAELHALGETDLTAERLESVEDPEVACLLLQAEVATVILNHFLSSTSLTRLDLSAESIVTHIGVRFLAFCTSLTSIDLSGLSNVTEVGACFLQNCINLTTLDISPLSNVMQVGACFLQHCSSLTTLDLSALSNVTSIMNNFISGCSSLTTLDISPLNNVTQVGESFLANCRSLTTLDLSPLSNVTYISSNLLGTNIVAGCTSLTSIYLSGCSSVVSNEVRKGEKLRKLVVETRPKRSRDESPEQSQKRQRHAQ